MTVSDPLFTDLVAEIIAAVERELQVEMKRLAADALRVWKKATPYVTGTLRGSLATVDISDVAAQRYGVRFVVKAPGSGYYEEVAELPRHAKLRALPAKWIDAHIGQYVDRAIDRALEETA